eukprot:1935799-Rhodomonas_salina.3
MVLFGVAGRHWLWDLWNFKTRDHGEARRKAKETKVFGQRESGRRRATRWARNEEREQRGARSEERGARKDRKERRVRRLRGKDP